MISFLGEGRISTPMARRLVESGYQLTVWNRTPCDLLVGVLGGGPGPPPPNHRPDVALALAEVRPK
jgi:hypothetical protein